MHFRVSKIITYIEAAVRGETRLSRLLLHASGTPCQRRRRQLSRWRHSVSISRHGSSASRIQISSSDLCYRLSNCVITV